jgi:hypothetical protein
VAIPTAAERAVNTTIMTKVRKSITMMAKRTITTTMPRSENEMHAHVERRRRFR